MALAGGILLLLCPPWVDGHGFHFGLAFVWSPPEPIPEIPVTLPNGETYLPPPPGLVTIDWATVVRGEVLIGLVAFAFIRLQTISLSTSLARNAVKAALLALVLPIPAPLLQRVHFVEPLGMQPGYMYTGSNHGIPMILLLGVIFCFVASWIFCALQGSSWLLRRIRGHRTDPPPAVTEGVE